MAATTTNTENIRQNIINFAAGPAKLPDSVLTHAQKELLNYNGTGISALEISHRSKEFEAINNAARQNIKDLLAVPDNYEILLMQAGATAQFAAIPMMLSGRSGHTECPNNDSLPVADYIVTGHWSAAAAKEAEKYLKVNYIIPKRTTYDCIPPQDTWTPFNKDALYVYYCDNETIHGIEFSQDPHFLKDVPSDIPIVCDVSSNFMSRPINVSKFGIIFGGAQKNIGCPGVTVVIVRKDLLAFESRYTPSVMSYNLMAQQKSLLNTPATFSVYIMNLVLQKLKEDGGIAKAAERSDAKARLLYDAIDNSDGFYKANVVKNDRSKMNVTYNLEKTELLAVFIKESVKHGLLNLEGHRSAGGLRASLYNVITVEETKKLVEFMKVFQENHK